MTVAELPAHLDWLLERDRDLELQDFCEPGPLPADWRERAAAARRLLDGWRGRLAIHGPYAGLDLASPDPDLRDLVRRRLDGGLDACAAVGADLMVVHSPVGAWQHHNRRTAPDAEARRLDALEATLRPALARAEALGVTLALENIEDPDPADRTRIVDALASPALRASLDTGHAAYAHGRHGGPPVDHYVAAAGGRLAHVHLQDADGYADRHWPPGDGVVPWAAVFAALARLDARPRLVLELADSADIPRGAAWLVARGLAA
jgi:sugar phosphate isomerase/epimerase